MAYRRDTSGNYGRSNSNNPELMTKPMESKFHGEFLKIVWPLLPRYELTATDGETVEIRSCGEYNPASARFSGAEIRYRGTVYHGDIVMAATGNNNPVRFVGCILNVTLSQPGVILKTDGTPLLQAVLSLDPVLFETYAVLRGNSANQGCARHIMRMKDAERINMFTRLETDRLHRKYGDLKLIYDECDQNWNETMYIMLIRTMGDSKNKGSFTELARRVHFTAISRERNTPLHAEAMLLGASGLLELYDDDSYIRELKTAFDYLRRKYSIVPMEPGRWIISNNNPGNHPVLRIAQLATFLTTREFLFDNLMKCRTVEHIHNMFRAEASQYWSTHYIPSQPSREHPKRIGHFKATLLGINLAVPMMFAYSKYTGDESLCETALDLLEKLDCESNRIIDEWRKKGVKMESAFDSQAMLQLNNEYCIEGLCWQCPVGKRTMREAVDSSFETHE